MNDLQEFFASHADCDEHEYCQRSKEAEWNRMVAFHWQQGLLMAQR